MAAQPAAAGVPGGQVPAHRDRRGGPGCAAAGFAGL